MCPGGNHIMKPSKLGRWFGAFTLTGFCALLMAQGSGRHDIQSGTSPGGTTATHPLQIALTGCLKQNGESGEYFIVDKNGKTWRLVPGGVDLTAHLNHSVRLTGTPDSNPNAVDNSEQTAKAGHGGEPQLSLRVLTVKMLSNSCGR